MGERLTKRAVDAIKGEGREAFLWDGELRGFGLRVRESGAKSFIFVYRPGGGRSAPKRKVTLGTYGKVTLDQARTAAVKLAGEVAHQRDPAAENRAGRRARAKAATSTVAGLVPVFVKEHHRARGNRWADEAERTLKFDAVRAWGSKPVADVAAADVTALLKEVAVKRKAPVQARKLYVALSRFFRWCVSEGYRAASPLAGVEKPAPETARERVISDAEIGLLWRAAETQAYPFGPCVQLLILTGARRNEIAEAAWSEFNLDRGEWLLPAERAKNKRAHLRHLSPEAVAILRAVPEVGDLVFSTTGDTAISGFSKIRTRLHAAMAAEAKRLGMPVPADDWTFHDLRRSLVTWLADAGFAVHVADKLLGHVSGSIRGVAAVYQRAEFLPERKAAMLAWGKHVASLADPSVKRAATVVPMRAARA